MREEGPNFKNAEIFFFSVICLPSTYPPTDTPIHTTILSLWEHLPTDHTHQETIKTNVVITTTHSQITTSLSSTLPRSHPPQEILFPPGMHKMHM